MTGTDARADARALRRTAKDATAPRRRALMKKTIPELLDPRRLRSSSSTSRMTSATGGFGREGRTDTSAAMG